MGARRHCRCKLERRAHPLAITGATRYRTDFACGGNAEGELGPVPEPRLAQYRGELETLLRSVLEQNGVSVVPAGEAEQTLEVAATIVETQSVRYRRCDPKETEGGQTCLRTRSSTKSQCGCVLVKEGKLNPDPYHFIVHAAGLVSVALASRLTSANETVIAEHTAHLFPAPSFNGGVVPCHGVRGQPRVLEQCQDVVASVGSGTTVRTAIPDWGDAFQASFSNATSPDNGGKALHDAMFPFEAQVRYTVFPPGSPDVARPAVKAIRAGRYEDAVVLFERGLGSVRENEALSPKARARYLYDFGVSLLSLGRRDEAKAAIDEANGILPDRRFAAVLAEIERQRADLATLDAAEQPGLAASTETSAPGREPDASESSLEDVTTSTTTEGAATPARDAEEGADP